MPATAAHTITRPGPAPTLTSQPEQQEAAPVMAEPQTVTFDEALAAAHANGVSTTDGPAFMAAFCDGPLTTIIGAISPRLVWEGARNKGLTTTQLAALAYGNPTAVIDLQQL
jgi:hypothetical protein